MSPATEPIEGISGPADETRWRIRTESIAETVKQLSRIWGGVAQSLPPTQPGTSQQSGSADVSESTTARRRGDPRLAPHMPDAANVRIRTRTSVLTLIVVASAEEVRARAMGAVTALAARHPSRAVILTPTDPDGPATFEAHINAACQVPTRGSSEVCTEEIVLRVGGELAQHLSSTVAPLIIHDLPAVLWWPDDAPFGSAVFEDLAQECDRILVDSGGFRGEGITRLEAMAQATRQGKVIHDIAWMRLELWRELVAGLFDHPLLQPELRRLTSVRIDLARPGSVTRLTRAALFVGWLAAMLDWQVVRPMEIGPDGIYRGVMRSGRREIPIEFRPVSANIDGPVRGVGSLVRVDLEAVKPRSSMRVRITRQSDHLLATADWNGAQVARRPARLEAFDETPFLGEALDRTGHDRVFEAAVDRAVKLTAALVPGSDASAADANSATRD